MEQARISEALASVEEQELGRFVRVADRLLAGHPLFLEGPWRRSLQGGRGLEFLDYQRYAAGSDARTVDWRASERSRHLLVRRYHDEAASEWHVCLDRSASMGMESVEKWLLAIQLAAAFSYLLLHRGNRVGLVTFSAHVDERCNPGRGRAQYARTIEMLSQTRPVPTRGGSNLAACSRRLGRRRSAVIISDFLALDGMRKGLSAIRKLGGAVHALQITSGKECALPETGRVLLEDIESGQQLVVEADDLATTSASRRLADQQQALGAFCARSAIPYSVCRTERSWKSILIGHLLRNSGDRP